MIQEKQIAQPFTLKPNSNIPPAVARLMSAKKEGYCRIANTRWRQLGLPNICQSVLTWNVKNLDIQQNNQSKILIQISCIKFIHLMVLNISSNNIQSIEGLTFINVRNLQQLNISNNKISNLQSLRRLHTFRLRRLKICNNPFSQILYLSQMPLMNLEVMVLQSQFIKSNRFINIWKMMKIQCVYLSSLYIRNWDFSFKQIGNNGNTIIRNRFIHLNPGRNI